MATAAGISYGVDSAVFAISLVFAVVVMYDATGVRRETGKQAVILNRLLLDNPFAWTGKEFEKKLKEYVGHSPLQVLMGAILGLIIAVGMGYAYGYLG